MIEELVANNVGWNDSTRFVYDPLMQAVAEGQSHHSPDALQANAETDGEHGMDADRDGAEGRPYDRPAVMLNLYASTEQRDGVYTRDQIIRKFNDPEYNGDNGLSEKDEEMIVRLEERDREVRQHEQTHAAALGPYGGRIQYSYQQGPDGKMYAVGGSIEVYVGNGPTPEATLTRARQTRQAAMAASDPSSADSSVAMEAATLEQKALRQLQANQ